MLNGQRQQQLDFLRIREAEGILTAAERIELDALFAALDAEEAEALRPAMKRMQQEQADLQEQKEALSARAEQLIATICRRVPTP